VTGPFDNALVAAMNAGECPDCESPLSEFLAGPSGGINHNVCCPSCWAAFNVGIFNGGVVSAERIPNHYWQGSAGYKEIGTC
jgi:hypothetical protein